MVAGILPLYSVVTLGTSPLMFGVIDGLYPGASAVRGARQGIVCDRRRRTRNSRTAGYALSAVCRMRACCSAQFGAQSPASSLADRTGKGVRTAPRDALISLSSAREDLGQRSACTARWTQPARCWDRSPPSGPRSGAVAFDRSSSSAWLGADRGGVLVLFVENKADTNPATWNPEFSLRSTREMLSASRYRTLCFAGAALSVMTVSDGFLYLALQHGSTSTRSTSRCSSSAPLCRTCCSPCRWAVWPTRLDAPVFIGGYLLLLLTYTALVVPELGPHTVPVYLLLLGGYYAATDGVFAALASAVLPAEVRTTGLAVLSTITALGGLVSALVFGALWTLGGVQVAALAFTGGLAVATLVVAVMFWRRGES